MNECVQPSFRKNDPPSPRVGDSVVSGSSRLLVITPVGQYYQSHNSINATKCWVALWDLRLGKEMFVTDTFSVSFWGSVLVVSTEAGPTYTPGLGNQH